MARLFLYSNNTYLVILYIIFSFFFSSCSKRNVEVDFTGESSNSVQVKPVSKSSNFYNSSLYLVEVSLCENEDLSSHLKSCPEFSILVWGSGKLSDKIAVYAPTFYFNRVYPLSRYTDHDLYNLVFSSYGCFADYVKPESSEFFHTLSDLEISLSKIFTGSEEIIEVPINSISVRRLKDQKEYNEIIPFDISSQQLSLSKSCSSVIGFSK